MQTLPSPKIMYNALLNKDSSYDGLFFIAVKTTGIFCRTVCTAKKPKQENVEFYKSADEALKFGYRPCKVCKPLNIYDKPDFVKKVLSEIEKDPFVRLNQRKLIDMGINPHTLARWFKKNLNMTFSAYHKMNRLNKVYGNLREGQKVTETAFDSGYESLSGFSDFFKKTTGFSPSESSYKNIVSAERIVTPLGPMLAAATDKGICLLEFVDRRMLQNQILSLERRLKAKVIPGKSPYFKELDKQMKEYFEGNRKDFDIPLDPSGTEFQNKVWKELMNIPYGKTVSYQTQANNIKMPKAVRAVANANGMNKISIIIPCHRVIGSDGTLTGYGGGLYRKKFLLDLEQKTSKLL